LSYGYFYGYSCIKYFEILTSQVSYITHHLKLREKQKQYLTAEKRTVILKTRGQPISLPPTKLPNALEQTKSFGSL
jgi:hypothetical protein